MSRLYRGLWYCVALHADGTAETTQPVSHDQAAIEAPLIGAKSVWLCKVPRSRSRWEYVATYEASDPPKWGDDESSV